MRRIQRDVRHEELVKILTNGETAIFREIWRLLLFCAALGIADGRRKPIEKPDSGKAIPESYFSSPGWRGFLYLIGISETDNSDCLKASADQQDYLITLFEEYANQGLYLLEEKINSSISPLDVFLELLLNSKKKQKDPNIFDLI